MTFDEISTLQSNSPFNKSFQQTDIGLRNFLNSLAFYSHPHIYMGDDKGLDKPSDIFEAVPEFQRNNDKWTQDMQVAFVENVVMGFLPTLMLARVGSEVNPCMLIDGLQRMTALYRFMTGEINAFGQSFDDLCEKRLITYVNCRISLRIYAFDNEADIVKFYIAMNENITHSPNDILRAKNYLAKLENNPV